MHNAKTPQKTNAPINGQWELLNSSTTNERGTQNEHDRCAHASTDRTTAGATACASGADKPASSINTRKLRCVSKSQHWRLLGSACLWRKRSDRRFGDRSIGDVPGGCRPTARARVDRRVWLRRLSSSLALRGLLRIRHPLPRCTSTCVRWASKRLGQFGPNLHPIKGAQNLPCNHTITGNLNTGALFNRNPSLLPVTNGGNRDIKLFGQPIAPTSSTSCGIKRVFASNWRKINRLHVCSLTRIVLINQHHVFTHFVFNNAL